MTTIMICWVIGALLPYVLAGASAPFRNQQLGSVDLAHPRTQGEQLVDAGARVVAAQGNAWEALLVFTVANVLALWSGTETTGAWPVVAVLWVVARILHAVLYIAGYPMGRVAAFVAGMVASAWIVGLAFAA